MARPGPKRDLAARRRILDAARALIAETGPNRVTVDDIATAAAVGKQTIYRWWPSKTAVVIDALEEAFEADNPFPDTGSVREDIRTQMRRVAAAFSSPTGAIIRQLVSDAQGDDVAAAEFRRRFFDQRRIRVRATIERGVARGELRDHLPIEAVIDALYAPLWLRLLVGHQPLDDAAVDELCDVVWPSIEER